MCRSILAELPEWFGIPEANDDYAEHADRHAGVIAELASAPIGITTIVRHSAASAEVYLMAVRPDVHRSGVGTAMLRHAEQRLAADGVRFLQVKTLSAAHPDAGYELTRRFYRAYGFVELEEFAELWGTANPALQMIKTVG